MDQLIVCLNCANLFNDNGENPLVCPNCGYPKDREAYHRISQYAHASAKYGYQYRLKFEDDVANGFTNKRHWIPDDPFLDFIAVTVIAGVIGGLAYDLVKATAHAIATQLHKLHKQPNDPQINPMMTEDKFDRFAAYLTDYYQGMVNVSPVVLTAITEEMMVASAVNPLFRPELRGLSEDELRQELKKIFNASHPNKPTSEDIEPRWQELGNPESLPKKAPPPKRTRSARRARVQHAPRKRGHR